MKRPRYGWRVFRAYRRFGHWLIPILIQHFRWHNTVLDTDIPNVSFLRLESAVMINKYGQRHTWPRKATK